MSSEERVDEILQRILEAIRPYQGRDDYDSILNALIQAISFQMAIACPICRRKFAKMLRGHIPEMLTDANRLAALAQRDECPKH